MARLLRGLHDLGDETLGSDRSATSVANTTGPDPQIVVVRPQGRLAFKSVPTMALEPLKSLVFVGRALAE